MKKELRRDLKDKLVEISLVIIAYFIGYLITNQLDWFYLNNEEGMLFFLACFANTVLGVFLIIALSFYTLLSIGIFDYFKEKILESSNDKNLA